MEEPLKSAGGTTPDAVLTPPPNRPVAELDRMLETL
jgi:hypothetical protein